MSNTYAVLEVSESTYAEITTKLIEAGYYFTFKKYDDGSEVIDMTFIALAEIKEATR